MPTFLLGFYLGLIFIRPMEWWGPVLGWRLVTAAAVMTLFAAMPKLLNEVPVAWRTVMPVRHCFYFAVGCGLSWLPSFWLGGMWNSFYWMFKIYVLFLLVILLGRTDKGYRIISRTILLCAMWMAIHAILQIHRGYGFAGLQPFWRVRDRESGAGVYQAYAWGIFEDPNDLCQVFIMAVPMLYAEFRSAPSPLFRMLALAGMPLVAYGAWCTNSRGGYVGVFAMVVAYLMSRTRGWKRWLLLGFAISFLTLVAPSRFAAGLVGQQDRHVLWGEAIAVWKAHPIFGVGFGDFGTYSTERKAAHNTYVHVLAETGMVGYIPFVLTVYFSFVHFRRAMNLGAALRPEDRALMAGLFAAAIGYFVSLYFLSRQHIHLPYVILGLMTAKALNVSRTPELFRTVFSHSLREYRRAILYAFGSIIFMWLTIRIVYAIS